MQYNNRFNKAKGRPAPVNLVNAIDRIQGQYPNKWFALQKEAIQNSYDARDEEKEFDKWGMSIVVDTRKKTIEIRDWGTTGILHMNQFLGLWDSTRSEDKHKGGMMGQGKLTLFLGDSLYVETFVHDKETRQKKRERLIIDAKLNIYPESNPENQYLFEKEPIQQRVVGTYMRVESVHDKYLVGHSSSAFNYGKFKSDIQQTWWQLLERGGNIIIEDVAGNRNEALSPLDYKTKCRYEEEFKNESYTHGRKKTKIKIECLRLELREENEEDIKLQSSTFKNVIPIQVNYQHIKSFDPPGSIPPEGLVLTGYCVCNDVRESQTPNHADFVMTDQWLALQDFIGRKTKEFLDPFREKRRRSNKSVKLLKDISDKLNEWMVKTYPNEFTTYMSQPSELIGKKTTSMKVKIVDETKVSKGGETAYITAELLDSKSTEVGKVFLIVIMPNGETRSKVMNPANPEHPNIYEQEVDRNTEEAQDGNYFIQIDVRDTNDDSYKTKKRRIFKPLDSKKRKKPTPSKNRRNLKKGVNLRFDEHQNPEKEVEVDQGEIILYLNYPTIKTINDRMTIKQKGIFYMKIASDAIFRDVLTSDYLVNQNMQKPAIKSKLENFYKDRDLLLKEME